MKRASKSAFRKYSQCTMRGSDTLRGVLRVVVIEMGKEETGPGWERKLVVET